MTHNLAWPGVQAEPSGSVIHTTITTRNLPVGATATRYFGESETSREVAAVSVDYRRVRFTDGTSTPTSPGQIWCIQWTKP